MARVWQSGFELASAGTELNNFGSPVVQTTIKRSGSYALQITSLSSGTKKGVATLIVNVSTSQAGPWYGRTYLYISTLPSAENRIIVFGAEVATISQQQAWITLDNAGVLRLYDEDGQIGSASSALNTGQWYRIEMLCDTNHAAGSDTVRARIDGVEFAGSTTRTISVVTTREFGVGGNLNNEAQTTGNWYFDDLAVNNNSGSNQTSYPGAGAIIHLRPNATGDNAQWTRTGTDSGNNWDQVNEITPNTSDLCTSNPATLDKIDDHNLTASGLAASDAINVVAVGVWSKGLGSSSNGQFVLRIKDRSNGAVTEGTAQNPYNTNWFLNNYSIDNTYNYPLVTYTKPSGGAWSLSDLDNAQSGYRISTGGSSGLSITTIWISVDYEAGAGTTTSTSTSSSTSTSTSSTTTSSSTSSTTTSSSTTTTRSTSTTTSTSSTTTSSSTTRSTSTSSSTSTSTSSTTTSSSTTTTRSTSTTTSTSSTTTSSSTTITTSTSTSTSSTTTSSSTTTTRSTSTSTSSTTTSSSTSSTTTSSSTTTTQSTSTSSTTTSSSTTRSTSTSSSTSTSTSSTTTSSSTTTTRSTSTSTSGTTTSTSSTTTSSSTTTTRSTSSSTSTSTTTTLDFTYKYYQYHVFNGDTYVTSWTKEVLSEPRFRNVINGGPGEVIVKLARKFDDFGENVDITLNYRVDIWVYDRESPNGARLYRGFISGYRPVLDGDTEYIEVTILSYVFQLGYFMLRDGQGTTTIAYNSQDPSTILKDVIAKYRADGGVINYTASSIATTGTTVSYTFNSNTVREAIDKIVELAPEGWYWTVDANSIIYFQSRSITADHTFVIGTHVRYMETWRRIEDVVNRVYFTGVTSVSGTGTTISGTGLYRIYSNSGSIDSYGLHAIHKVDGRVSVTGTADTMANRILNAKKDPEIRTSITILDNNGNNQYRGYDIESIVPGDTLKIRNIKSAAKTYTLWDLFSWDVDVWDQTLTTTAADVIQILAFDYEPNQIRIEASSRLPEVSKRIEDIDRNLTGSATENNPVVPVTG